LVQKTLTENKHTENLFGHSPKSVLGVLFDIPYFYTNKVQTHSMISNWQ